MNAEKRIQIVEQERDRLLSENRALREALELMLKWAGCRDLRAEIIGEREPEGIQEYLEDVATIRAALNGGKRD